MANGVVAQELQNGSVFHPFLNVKQTPSEVGADANNQIVLSYCDEKVGGYLDAQNSDEIEFGACIYFSQSHLKNYVGSKISAIDFGLHDATGRKMVVFISTSLGGQPVLKQTVTNFAAGWNHVELKTPYDITGTEDLYIGYIIYTSTQRCADIQFDGGSTFIKGVNYGVNGINARWSSLDPIKYNLQIKAYATGDNLPKNWVGVSNLDAYDIITRKNTKFTFQIKNYGVNDVNSIEATCKINGEVKKVLALGNMKIANNNVQTIELTDVSLDKLGNNVMEVSVDKVNDVDNFAKDVLSKKIYYTNGVDPSTRQTLVEQFTLESDSVSVIADSVYSVVASSPNLSWVSHHVAYEGDQFTVPESYEYLRFYDSNEYYVPGLMVDRTFINGFQDVTGPVFFVAGSKLLQQIVNLCQVIPSFVTLNVQDKKVEKGKLSFNLNVHTGVGEMPLQNDVRLTVFVVENNIYSTKQVGRRKGYYQNHVLRKVLTKAAGDAIDLSAMDVNKSYSVDIPEGWNADNLEVIAFVSNYDETNVNNNMVYNSVSQKIGTGIIGTEQDAASSIVSSKEAVWLEGGHCNSIQIYDMSGRLLMQKDSNYMPLTGLQKGFYIVSVVDNGKKLSKKISVL